MIAIGFEKDFYFFLAIDKNSSPCEKVYIKKKTR